MTSAPIFVAPAVVQAHLALAMAALASGTGVLFAKKGTPLHRRLGTIFAAAMLVVAASSFWITGLWPGHYSPIHILSIVTLVTIPLAIWRRRRGDIRAHAVGMALNYVGLAIAGLFALDPGRVLGMAIFGP